MLLSLIFCVQSRMFAQDNDADIDVYSSRQLKNTGEKAILRNDYATAAVYFEQYLKNNPNDFKIAYQLAEAYRINRDYENAEKWYKRAYNNSDKKDALSIYYYALMLKLNGDCEKSKETFLKFNKLAARKKDLDFYTKQAKLEIEGCDLVDTQDSRASNVQVLHLDTSINKVHVEHAPLMIDSNTIIYASLRTDGELYRYLNPDSANRNVRKFYKAVRSDSNWVYAGELEGPFNDSLKNTTNGSLSADGRRFYFTRCEANLQNKVICSIYVSARKKDGSWSEPVELNEKINLPDYTATQPAATLSGDEEEVVYFVSDRPGGKGGLDIWYFTYNLKDKTYSTPVNTGEKVNSALDEITPYYDMETYSLFFSSNGWIGMGGFDIFKSEGEKEKFSSPKNLGNSINSTYDDIYYSEGESGGEGFFVSNRKGGVNISKKASSDDIYTFKRLQYVKREKKQYAYVPEEEEPETVAKVETVPVEKTDSSKSLVLSKNNSEEIKDSIAPSANNESVVSIKEIQEPKTVDTISNPVLAKEEPAVELKKDTLVQVSPSVKETPKKDIVKNITVAPVKVDSNTVKSALVKEKHTAELKKDTLVQASPSNKEIVEKDLVNTVTTPIAVDSAVLKPALVKENHPASKVLKDTVVVAKEKPVVKNTPTAKANIEKTTPSDNVVQRDSVLVVKRSSGIILRNVYYEFNKADLTANSKTVIDTTLLVLLKENPKIRVKISSHADSKGSDEYNLRLSQRRAMNVVAYLVSKGIRKTRLVAKGYGETQPIAPNENPDGSDNPAGREKNRRTEFKIISE